MSVYFLLSTLVFFSQFVSSLIREFIGDAFLRRPQEVEVVRAQPQEAKDLEKTCKISNLLMSFQCLRTSLLTRYQAAFVQTNH